MRAVAGRSNKIRFRFEAEDGTLTAVDSATSVDVTVTAGDGTQLATGTAQPDGTNTGVYAYTLAPQTQLDVLTATAVGYVGGDKLTVMETVQLVDRRMVALSVMRQDDALSSLSVLDFLRVVDEAEDAIANELNFSPVLAGARVEFRSRETARLFLPGYYYPNQLYTLTRNDEDQLAGNYSPGQVHIRDNALERGYGATYGTGYYDPILGVYGVPWLPGVYKAWFTHGWEATPSDLQKAIVMLARHYALEGGSAYPDRATRIMTEQSEIWFAKPGTDNPFGLPEVDAAIVRWRMPEPLADDPGAF